jgi:large subunit ribosomal protein L25
MAQINLTAFPRTGRGKGPSRRLRATGRFPGVIYGGDCEPQSIALDRHDFDLHLHRGLSSSSLVTLQIEGQEPQLAILRDLQRDPLDQRLRHVDFYRVRLDQKIEFEVPVHGIGTSPGVKAGGIIEHVARTVALRCLPTAVPAHLEVSLDNLNFGHPLHLSDIQLPAGVEAVDPPDTVLFSVVMPRAVVAAEAAVEGAPVEGAEEAPAEPELIGKGKKEEGEEAEEKPEKPERGERGEKKK